MSAPMNSWQLLTAPVARVFLLLLLAGVVPAIVRAGDNPLGLKAHHVTASVTDIDRAVKWYQDVLGFKLVERGSRGDGGKFQFAELEIAGYGVALVQTGLPAVSVPLGTLVRPSWVHVVFSVPDPDAIYRSFKKRGLDVYVHTPTDTAPVDSFLIHDSEGNEIEFVAPRPKPDEGKQSRDRPGTSN